MTQPTEIERAACTMLASHRGDLVDPAVDQWTHRIIGDPDYDETGDMVERRTNVSGHRYVDWSEFESDYRRYAKGMNDAMIDLGIAICHYRLDGRPIGDQEHQLGGLGNHIVVTSLAAAIVEFHRHVLNAYQALGE